MMRNHGNRRVWAAKWTDLFRSSAAPLAVFVSVVVSWEVFCHAFNVPVYLLPSPSRIVAEIRANSDLLAKDTLVTGAEAILGFLVANIFALIVATAFAHFTWLERSFYPYVIGLKAAPLVALAPLLVLWVGYGMFGKAILAAVIAFFPLVVTATTALKSVERETLDLFRSLSATPLEIYLKLRLPGAMPMIFSGLKISSTLSVVGAIVAELTGATRGLGFSILMASYNVDTPLLFSSILAACILGVVFFYFVALLERVFSR